MKDRDFARLQSLANEIATTLQRKNILYGDSFSKTPEILKILFPTGVQPTQYENLLTLVRMLDKINRIAAQGQGQKHIQDCEDPYTDLAGYAILAQVIREGRRLDEKEVQAKACSEAAEKIYTETNKILVEAAKANPRAVVSESDDVPSTATFKFRRG